MRLVGFFSLILAVPVVDVKLLRGVVVDDEGRPVPGVVVRAFSEGCPRVLHPAANLERFGCSSVAADSEGRFEVEALQEEFYISAEHTDFAVSVVGPFGPDSIPDAVRVGLREGGRVEGVVLSGKEPVEGAKVEVELVSSPDLPFGPSWGPMEGGPFGLHMGCSTGKGGRFSFGHLIPGTYRLYQMVSVDGFEASARYTTVAADEGRTTFRKLGGWGGAVVRGKVVDEAGEPLPRVIVCLRVRDDPLRSNCAATDRKGCYKVKVRSPST